MYKNNIFKKSLFMNAIYHILNRFTLINNSLIEIKRIIKLITIRRIIKFKKFLTIILIRKC